jgi:hypothetical protein
MELKSIGPGLSFQNCYLGFQRNQESTVVAIKNSIKVKKLNKIRKIPEK